MKLHRNLVHAVAQAITQITEEANHAETVVENLLASNKKWGARDRHFIAENIYEIIRHQLLLRHCANSSNPFHLLAARYTLQGLEIPDWAEFKDFTFSPPGADLPYKITYSIPDWLNEFGIDQLGEKNWQQEMQAMHTTAKTCLRINTLKATAANASKQLEAEGIAFTASDNFLILNDKRNIQNTIAYKSGWVEIQDGNSQKIAPLLQVKPKEIVIDACAGAGGKTLQLAAEMKNEGHIFALDVFEKKLQELNRRAQRAGAKNISTLVANQATLNQLKNKADKLLLDVPCSGSGVFRRKPDSKFKLSPQRMQELQNLQWQILSTYHTMLKSGGTMLYATCSIFPSENNFQVQRFLNEYGTQFCLEKEYFLSPAETGLDGFYAAVFTKK
ncbi:MAG: RsmB/NOP family class I SAM-dependent RNA methyltransferase [Chitinophagales bacterium]|nr:RsmB/NOP family class I SAM-dependent RNA methyltransferase [Chitinophagales bacterium]